MTDLKTKEKLEEAEEALKDIYYSSESMLENDEISPEEEGFMKGYSEEGENEDGSETEEEDV